ncbi:MAG: DegT/DnrJ/EryC1/StrS family aminotransferase, partial [Nitrospiraceae bacterium]|nr:DegT/DnrJ/EryC1/StrS family aminotransferase [Nitrospiraceae bacterium]
MRITLPTDRVRHSYYKHYVFLHPERLRTGWNRDRIISALQIAGVPCSIGSCSEIYLEQAFPPEWRPTNRFPVARELGDTSLMFPVHPTLSAQDIQQFCDAVSTVMQSA